LRKFCVLVSKEITVSDASVATPAEKYTVNQNRHGSRRQREGSHAVSRMKESI
jgi:hypothetical protein